MKTIFIIMDSLNKHYLNAYGQNKAITPNLDRLAKKSVVFDQHFSGSLPCMPARREMMTGRLNFLEAPWGPIEPWDDCLPVELRNQKKIYSHIITDHYHYFHSGGEAYHTLFDSWEFPRGQEGDKWKALVEDPEIPKFKGKNRRPYWVNRKFIDSQNDEDYPTPQCFMKAMDFVENNHNADNWHLHLEVFDPHEPFVSPDHYKDLYGAHWDKDYHFDWPSYGPIDGDPDEVEYIRKCYNASLTMADVWLGKFLDKMDEYDMWKDTAVILTSDHGHLLGEHGYWAKNYMFDYQELVNIPLFIHLPEKDKKDTNDNNRINALTATMDIMPTLMELHGAQLPPNVHGKSLLHLLQENDKDEEKVHHDAVIYGYFSKDVNIYDGRYSYCRQPLDGSYLYHYTAMPRGFSDFISRKQLASAEMGVFLNTTYGIPHYRMPINSKKHMDAPDYNIIYDLKDYDPNNQDNQSQPVHDKEIERKLENKLKELLIRYDAPECQFERLGLK